MIQEYHDGQIIVLAALPASVHEAVTPNEDGTYTIVLNEDLCPEKRLDAYRHALCHIGGEDFRKTDVQRVESAAHNVK